MKKKTLTRIILAVVATVVLLFAAHLMVNGLDLSSGLQNLHG